jgi:hypothetical protein
VEAAYAYFSPGPQWAFEFAKLALVEGKQLWIASNGEPFGANLVSVTVPA